MSKSVLSAYAAYSVNNPMRKQSSSGGIFSLVAEQIIMCDGCVYGVALTDDCTAAEFIRVDRVDDLNKLRGSKYLQARLGDTFLQVKADLEEGRYVLFCGTGCQVNGLKYFLRKDYENLLCIDVVCHGVPSPALWRKYVVSLEQRSGKKLVYVNFRSKEKSWKDFGMNLVDDHQNAKFISKDVNPYMHMFLRNYSLRPSCYACAAKNEKLADMTIADFWGIENVAPQMNDGQGTSLVLVRSDKGREYFNRISSDIKYCEVSYEQAVKWNSAEYRSVARPKEREHFFDDMVQNDFKTLARMYGLSLGRNRMFAVLRKGKRMAGRIMRKLKAPYYNEKTH